MSQSQTLFNLHCFRGALYICRMTMLHYSAFFLVPVGFKLRGGGLGGLEALVLRIFITVLYF